MLLPGRLVQLKRRHVCQRLNEGIVVGPVQQGGAGLDARSMDGMSALVQQLGEVVKPAGEIGGEDPGLVRREGRTVPLAAGTDISVRDRVLPWPGQEVVAHVEPRGICADCIDLREAQFHTVREWLRDNGGAYVVDLPSGVRR